VIEAVATEGRGVDEVRQAVADHLAWLTSSGERARKRRARLRREVEVLAAERFRVRASAAVDRDGGLLDDLEAGRIDPYRAATLLVESMQDGP
jgi:LAO/AO transport system kinase